MSDDKCITSIVLVTCNELDYTKQCVESIQRHTERGSYELIIVDNGSIDGTVQWAKKQGGILVIDNGCNVGSSKGCNIGLAAASGELLMLLNHDMIVTPGWLDGLKRCLRSDDRIGAVSPVTNSDSYWTAITVPYKTIEEMELYACALHALPDKAKWEECIKLVSYCLLIRREAWEQAGPLDESFDMSDFEVDDYSLRLRLAGYRLMLGGDTFIHSSGENTASSADPAEFQERFKGNSKVFMRKWGFYPSDITFMRKDISTVIQRESHEYKRKACSIMELGCGCGAAALYLKKPFLTARWYGVEQNELAATIAETSGMTVFRSSEPEDWLLPAEGWMASSSVMHILTDHRRR